MLMRILYVAIKTDKMPSKWAFTTSITIQGLLE